MSTADEIMQALKDLKKSNGNIKAAMVAKRGLEGLMMFPPDFKEEVSPYWEPLSKDIDDMLTLVQKYGSMGLKRQYSEILGFGIFFRTIESSDTALIAIVQDDNPPKLASEICESLEKTHKDICKIIC